MLRRLAWAIGSRLIEWSERDLDVVTRLRYAEQRHTPLTVHRRGREVEVTGCGRSVRLRVYGQ
jgi:hypothetical protein